MKKPIFSIAALRAATWSVTFADCDCSNIIPAVHDDENDGYSAQSGLSEAYGSVTLTADIDGFTAVIDAGWQASGDTDGTFADLYNWGVSFSGDGFEGNNTANFELIDDDGETLSLAGYESIDFLESLPPTVTNAIHAVLPTCPAPESVDGDNTVHDFIVERDDDTNLSFAGDCIADVTNKDPYDDRGRWTELSIYRTKGGKYIAQRVGRTRWQGEHTRNDAAVCATPAAVIEYFGLGRLAKSAYDEAGFDYSESVE